MTTLTPVTDIAPINRDQARILADREYARLADLFRSLSPDEWTKPTDCPLWDVRAAAGHSVAMMGDFTSLRSVMRRMRKSGRRAKATGEALADAMTATQVADLAALSTDDLVALADEHGPLAARWRASANGLFRRMKIKEEVGGVPETWRMAYLLDTILTRDPWMHRVDIARATGREMALTPDHDGRIVADVVAEWARRHGRPFALVLTGPAGGEFVAGDGSGEHLSLDAVEFCRILSGRASGTGLLSQKVPF